MSRGPRNQLVQEELERQAQERIAAMRLPPMPPIREWRLPPDGREYARRHQVWELLAWYHHDFLRNELGVRAWIRRKWRWLIWKLFDHEPSRVRLMTPWQQLALQDRWRAEEQVRNAAVADMEEERQAEGRNLKLEG